MLWSAVSSRMGKRMSAVLALCATVPLVVFATLILEAFSSMAEVADSGRLSASSSAYASQLLDRLAAADALAVNLTAEPLGTDVGDLKQRIAGSQIFKSAVLVPTPGLLADEGGSLRPSPEQLLELHTGQTALLTMPQPNESAAVFLGRLVNADGTPRVAYLELNPAWFWRTPRMSGASMLSVVDVNGQLLQGDVPRTGDTAGMFAHGIKVSRGAGGAPRALGWFASNKEWRGALSLVVPAGGHITAAPFGVVAFEERPSFIAAARSLAVALPISIGVALLAAVLGTFYLAGRFAPALSEVRRGLMSLRHRNFRSLQRVGRDEPRSLIDTLNRTATSIEEQLRALETLAEIDRLLLGSPELEQVLDAMLSRVQVVTRCQSVGIALRDADAPGRARVYLRCIGKGELPVSRVALDEDMLNTLAQEPGGITVARCEEARHSFLRPLGELGSEYFWVWPVMAADRIEAILSVGYWEAPATDPQVAEYGAEFASRLAIALSKNARDERLYRQAHYDPLTALPNRLLFRDRLAQEITTATSGLSRGALLYIDLDHFKRVNDSVGHVAGDQLLTIVAQRLRSCVKDGDTVARLGGDEFTVILRHVTDPDAARAVAERVIESLNLPVNIAGRDHFVCASIGITLFPDDGASIEDLMRNADTAMYRAKDLGRGRTMFFDRSMMVEPAPATESGLHRALRRREFSLFYQPQFAIADGALVGVEALLRWQTSRDGMRQPGDFVPAAEESGLIVDIGGWVLDSACAQMAEWRDREIAPLRMALNVSAQQLRHPEFTRNVRRVLDKYGLPAQLLELEIPPDALTDEQAAQSIARLAQIGTGLSLDDFGTGAAALGNFRAFPFGAVKIDRGLLDEVPLNPASASTVETIVAMAHTAGRRVVAEGVESVEQLDFLRERHCDVVQGFYLARPLTAQAITELLEVGSTATRTEVRAAG